MHIRFFIKNRADFYLTKCRADFLLKTKQIFIRKKCRSDFINRADFYLEKMHIRFYIKNRADFYLEKCRSGFTLKKKQRGKKNTDLTLNKKMKKTCKFDFSFFFNIKKIKNKKQRKIADLKF